MEAAMPAQEFHFHSTTATPYVSAPSSPRCFDEPFDLYWQYCTSAPTSPTRAAAIRARFNTLSANNSPRRSSTSSSSAIPFYWEEKPGTPKGRRSTGAADDGNTDATFNFAFGLSGQLDESGMLPVLTAADELFEEGKIRPLLKPPPRLQNPIMDGSSPRSPRSPKLIREVWSPIHRWRREKGGELDPFTAAMVEATRDRGRERAPTSPSISSSRSRKGSRSLSPLRGRGGRGGGGGGGGFFQKSPNSSPPPTSTTATPTNTVKSGGSKKWRLRDLLLFRSASEGLATGSKTKDPLLKYMTFSTSNSSSSSLPSPVSKRKGLAGREDSKNSSFRSVDSDASMPRGNRLAVSAHEMHYIANRAVTEAMKKKTPLPYRQILFGYLRFNPAFNRGISSSFTHERS